MNLRYFLRLIKAYINRFSAIMAVSVLIGVLVFFLGKFLAPKLLVKTQRIGVTGRCLPNELPDFILTQIGDGLTKVNESGISEPNLAESWETPDKGKTWIFHLKGNLFWHDKTPVTSDTLNYEFSDVEIETPDEKTIVFKLKNPYSPFPEVVSKITFRKGLVGTGDWKVEKIILSGSFVQEILISSDKERRLYKFYPTNDSTKTAFKLGHFDQIVNLLDPKPFDNWKNVKLESTTNKNQVVTLFFNTQAKLFSDKSARQALSYAIDKDTLGVRAISPISPQSWSYNPQVKKYTFDKDRAKEIIESLPKELIAENQIKLVTTPTLLSTAEKIERDWESLGIDVIIQVSSIIPQEYDAYLSIYDIPKDPDQYPMWHSTQSSNNISNYSNPRIDKLLEDGRSSLDYEERKKIYFDFQRFLLEDAPAVFLIHPTYYTVTRL